MKKHMKIKRKNQKIYTYFKRKVYDHRINEKEF